MSQYHELVKHESFMHCGDQDEQKESISLKK